MSELKFAESLFLKDPQVNQIWENWAKSFTHSSLELEEIVQGDFQEEFQKRALFLLLSPNTCLFPCLWTHQYPYHFLNREIDFAKVEVYLRAHAVYWLTKFIDYTRFNAHDMDQATKALALSAYNKYIVQLLAVLPAEDNQAEEIFPYFSLEDYGYDLLFDIWKNPQINEKWKRGIDAQMRRIISAQLVNPTPNQNPLFRYFTNLQNISRISPFPYSNELLADQINFISSLEISDRQLVLTGAIPLILNLLSENKPNNKFKSVRLKFIKFAVLRDGNFKIHNEETEKAALTILKDCDQQIEKLVKDQLNMYYSIRKREAEKIEEKKMTNENLLSPMRKTAQSTIEYRDSEF